MNGPTRREREQREREEAILSKAEELFCRKGYDRVSMDDLARESEFTKRTIYRYFSCKEDLFFAVALRGYKGLFERMDTESRTGRTGLEKIKLAYNAYYGFYRQSPEMLQLMNLTGIVKSASTDLVLPWRKEYADFDRKVFEALIQVFQEGKKDGSIRTDLEVSQLALSSIFLATGFFQLLSLSGRSYTDHFGLDMDSFVQNTVDMMTDSLSGGS